MDDFFKPSASNSGGSEEKENAINRSHSTERWVGGGKLLSGSFEYFLDSLHHFN